jgi:hypothetical protein
MTPRKRLKQTLDIGTKKALALEQKQINALVSVYKKSLADVEKKLKALYDGIGNIDAVTKRRRIQEFKSFKNQVAKALNELTGEVIKLERLSIAKQFVTAHEMTAWSIETSLNADLGFKSLNKRVVEQAVRNDFAKVSWLKSQKAAQSQSLFNLRTTLADKFANGMTYKAATKQLQSIIDGPAYEAMRILRTEGHRVTEEARDNVITSTIEAAGDLGFEAEKQWFAVMDQRTRETHRKMNGKVADKKGLFHFPAGNGHGPLKVPGPGRTGEASEDINCFPGETFVVSPHRIEGTTKRYYVGDVITLRLASGIQLTGTPNHPVLTSLGWIGFNQIKNETDVLCGIPRKEMGLRNPNINDRPITIAKMFNLSRVIGTRKRVRLIDKQFHGDGGDGNVDIISIDGILKDRIKTKFDEPFGKHDFAPTYFRKVRLFCQRLKVHFGFRSFPPASSGMSLFCKMEYFIRCRLPHPFEHRLASISRNDTARQESPSYRISCDSKIYRKELLGFTGEIFLDKVVDVNVRSFRGHVYNLQTEKGYYLASDNIRTCNGKIKQVFVHNCRCTVIMHLVSIPHGAKNATSEPFGVWRNRKGIK